MDRTDASTARKRLLFVEDDRDNLDTLSMILDERYAVFGYPSAADGVKAIEAIRPDLVLLDIGMHPVDGLECLKTIRAMPGYGSIPAVALTGFGRMIEREKFLAGGFQDVVVKPVMDHDQLFATIDRLLFVLPLDVRPPLTTFAGRRAGDSDGGAQT